MSRDPRRPPQGGAGVTHVCHIKATTSLACVKGRHANQPWYLSCTILYKTKRRLGEKNQSGAPCTRQVHLQRGGPSFFCHEETSSVSFSPLLFFFPLGTHKQKKISEGESDGVRRLIIDARARGGAAREASAAIDGTPSEEAEKARFMCSLHGNCAGEGDSRPRGTVRGRTDASCGGLPREQL